MAKATPISIRLEQETRDGLERAAREDKRTLNSMVEKALSDWLAEKGYLGETSKAVPARRRKAETAPA
jgi:predicted transcriptional regulator